VAATGAAGPVTVEAVRTLVATGRHPRDGVGLAAAGIRTDQRGYITVDRRLRTSNPRVYAAGDITGGPAFTHVAALHGSVAAGNALLGPLRAVDHDRMPRVTFTDPEIAHVGLTEAQARDRHGDTVRVRSLPHERLDRAVTEDDTDGVTRVVLDAKGRVLGATIVAPRAGELVTELAVLVAHRGRLRDLASVVHPYPSWSQAVWNLAVAESTAALTRPAVRRAVALVRRVRAAPGSFGRGRRVPSRDDRRV
jgi:pyruvate/2-oxoglutarate dehydrogenase complex dihydrolipoamide dehydrogenase (E3) component